MSDSIDTVAELEAQIGKPMPLTSAKVIDHLDEGALRWIDASPLMFASFAADSNVAVTLGGGEPGWASGDKTDLRLPPEMLDDVELAKPGAGFGSLFVVPGISEVIRINGRVTDVRADAVRVKVQECYTHCGKALIRSGFWSASPMESGPTNVAALLSSSRFMALGSVDAHGHADLSPKGDRAGTMARIEDGALWFADRPGNRRTDSFRNILTQPQIAAVLLIPGTTSVAHLTGTAHITTDQAVRERFAVEGKTPVLVTRVDDLEIGLRKSAALGRAPLWPVSGPPAGIDFGKIGLAHLKRARNVGAKVAGTLLSPVSSLLKKGMERDYKKNLF